MNRARKLTIAIVGSTVLMFGLVGGPAIAQMNCNGMLDTHSAMINSMSTASAEKRAALRRMALQGYDHCMAGDMVSAEKFFKMVEGGNQR